MSRSGAMATFLLLLQLTANGCAEPEPEIPDAPPLGVWPIEELSGRIDVVTGGTAVLCSEGTLERYPQQPSEGLPSLSYVELLPNGRLHFALAFDAETKRQGRQVRSFQILGHRAESDPVDPPGGITLLRPDGQTFARWSWQEKAVEGSFRSESTTGEVSEGRRVTLEIEGRFGSPLELFGTWRYEEEDRQPGNCWRRANGRGEWTARPTSAAVPAR